MPELNGIEATRLILEAYPSVKVIILSMHSDAEHIFWSLRAGVQGYVLKKSAGQEVVDAIRSVYAGHRYISQSIAETVIDEYIRISQDTSPRSPLEKLSSREKEVLQLVVEDKSTAEIAEILYLSPKTVHTYRSRLMKKLGMHSVSGLVKFAIQHGLTSME